MLYEINFAVLMQVADDPVFAREGADVYVDANISFTQVRTEILCKILVEPVSFCCFIYLTWCSHFQVYPFHPPWKYTVSICSNYCFISYLLSNSTLIGMNPSL